MMKWLKSIALKVKTASSFLVLALLSISLFLLIMYQGGKLPYFLFFAIMPIFFYVFILFLYPLSKIEVKQNVRQSKDFGDELSIEEIIELPFPIPLYMISIHPRVPERMGECPSIVELLSFKGSIRREYSFRQVRRGEYELSEVEIHLWDIFGFIQRSITKPVYNKILVYPHYMDLSPKDLQVYTEQGWNMKNKDVRDHQLVVGNREYQRGDRFSWIDWKASARKQDLVTKEFSDVKENELCIYQDCSMNREFEGIVSVAMGLVVACHKREIPFQWVPAGNPISPVQSKGRTTPEERRAIYRQLSIIQENEMEGFTGSFLPFIEGKGPAHASIFLTANLTGEVIQGLINNRNIKSMTIYYIYQIQEKRGNSLSHVLKLKSHRKFDLIGVGFDGNKLHRIGRL